MATQRRIGNGDEELPPSVVCCGVGLYMHPGQAGKGGAGPWVWNPTESASLRWTTIVWIATMITSLGVLGRIGFRPAVEPVGVVVETLCDLILAADILVMFHTAYEEKGLPVVDLTLIKDNYKKGWLIPDVIAVLPVHFAALGSAQWYGYLRLPKLLRAARFGSYFENWEQSSRVPNVIRLIRIGHIVGVCTHALTCVYWFIAREQGFGSTAWTPTKEQSEEHIFTQYTSAIFFVSNSMSVQGGNSETRAPSNGLEYGFTLVAMTIGVVLYTLIIGTVATLLANLNENKEKFRNKVNAINKYMSYRGIPDDIRTRVRAYFNYLWSRQQGYVDNDILAQLPPHIQVDICLHLYSELISKVQFFQECSPAFINLLVVKLQMEVYAPGDFIIRAGDIGMEMYFILSGEADVEVGGNVVGTMKTGAFFGEIALLSASPRTASIVAAAHCDLLKLTKQDLEEALQLYPEQMKVIEAVARQRLQRTHGKDKDKSGPAPSDADGVRKTPTLARRSQGVGFARTSSVALASVKLKTGTSSSSNLARPDSDDGSKTPRPTTPPSSPPPLAAPKRPATSWAPRPLSSSLHSMSTSGAKLPHEDEGSSPRGTPSPGTAQEMTRRGLVTSRGAGAGLSDSHMSPNEWYRRLAAIANEDYRDHMRRLSKRQLMQAHKSLQQMQNALFTYAMYGSKYESGLTSGAGEMGLEDDDVDIEEMITSVDSGIGTSSKASGGKE
eukprot:TRINITY_DN2303_c0_g1_i1.p1 TRINITY_DN2303_c0_g1~~TRINITY_DN2303_c0_g1_i1.p1  ORF type:complete len:725 (+),score=131.03 TRINITY_DN2303_c0_g1_i1:272-2446(+)